MAVRAQQPESVTHVGGVDYKWIALSNTTLGILMATLNASIVLIALPTIFTGIHINPLTPGNTGFLLWILMGYMVVTSTLLVTCGRISDMLGRVKSVQSRLRHLYPRVAFAVPDTQLG